jgi:hypothetical protein
MFSSAGRDRNSLRASKTVVVSCLAALLLAAVPASAIPIITIVPSSSEVTVGDTFTVNFLIGETNPGDVDDVTDLSSFVFGIAYDLDILAFVDVSLGSFFSDVDGVSLDEFVSDTFADFSLGYVSPILLSSDPAALLSGSGILLTATFVALQEGTGAIAAAFNENILDGLYSTGFPYEGEPLLFDGSCDDLLCDVLITENFATRAVSGSVTVVAPPTQVPEPGTLLLLSTGMAVSAVAARRRRRTARQ